MTQPPTTAQQWIDRLDLTRHPEGGFYRESYRSDHRVVVGDESHDRSASTAIYFLVTSEEPSRFHRLRSDEVWHFHAGQTLRLHLLDPKSGEYRSLRLGLEGEEEIRPQQVVPGGTWFAAEVERPGYTLAGCTVAPGFEFEDFEMGVKRDLLDRFPGEREIISRLTPE